MESKNVTIPLEVKKIIIEDTLDNLHRNGSLTDPAKAVGYKHWLFQAGPETIVLRWDSSNKKDGG